MKDYSQVLKFLGESTEVKSVEPINEGKILNSMLVTLGLLVSTPHAQFNSQFNSSNQINTINLNRMLADDGTHVPQSVSDYAVEHKEDIVFNESDVGSKVVADALNVAFVYATTNVVKNKINLNDSKTSEVLYKLVAESLINDHQAFDELSKYPGLKHVDLTNDKVLNSAVIDVIKPIIDKKIDSLNFKHQLALASIVLLSMLFVSFGAWQALKYIDRRY